MTLESKKIKLLRIWGQSDNISAIVFDDLFRKNIGSLFCTDYISSQEFATLASEPSRCFAVFGSYDFICPDFQMMTVVPWMMQVRNQNDYSFGIVYITHSPGLYGLEWYLIRDLISPRDIIIAPSRFSADVISFLAPSLESNVEVISHPLDLKTADGGKIGRGDKIVTLSRISEHKLIHRQIDAMDLIVHKYKYHHLKMVIGGSLNDSGSKEPTSYARLLQYKIKQKNLQQHVFLAGEISDSQKDEFFTGSFASVNLSRTLEEAFPKAAVESLGHGIPVAATLWNGFREIVGPAGILLELDVENGRADLDPEALARVIISLYENPVSREKCFDQVKQYDVSLLQERYKTVLLDRISRNPKSESPGGTRPGLLDTLSFLKVFSHTELMTFHCKWAETYFKNVGSKLTHPIETGETFFRFFIADSIREILTGFYAFKYSNEVLHHLKPIDASDAIDPGTDFRQKIQQSIYISNNLHSKKTLLKVFSQRPDAELLKEAIGCFNQSEGGIPDPDYYIPYADFLAGKNSAVCRFYTRYFKLKKPALVQADQLCLWSKAALKCDETRDIIAVLSGWLNSFAGEPEALLIHAYYLKLLIQSSEPMKEVADNEFALIKELCFDRKLVEQFEVLRHAK